MVTNNGFGCGTVGAIALVAVLLGGGTVAGFNACNGEAAPATEEVAEEVAEVDARVATPIPGVFTNTECIEGETDDGTICRVNPLARYPGVVRVEYMYEGEVQYFRVNGTANDDEELVGSKGECKGKVLTDLTLEGLLAGGTRCNATVSCEHPGSCASNASKADKAKAIAAAEGKPASKPDPKADEPEEEVSEDEKSRLESLEEDVSVLQEDVGRIDKAVAGIAGFIASLTEDEESEDEESEDEESEDEEAEKPKS
jgi:hypothetical protein